MEPLYVEDIADLNEKTGKEFPCNDGHVACSHKFMGILVTVRYNCENRILNNMYQIRKDMIQDAKEFNLDIDIQYGKLSGLILAIYDLDMIESDSFLVMQNRLLKLRRKLKELHK